MLSLAELERVARVIDARYTGLHLDKAWAAGPAAVLLALSGRAQRAGAESAGAAEDAEGAERADAAESAAGAEDADAAEPAEDVERALDPTSRVKRRLVLDAAPGSAHAGEPASDPRSGETGGAPPAFVQYLRAHLAGARCCGAEILGGDRQLALRFASHAGERTLLLSLLGPRSNLWLLGPDRRVEVSLRPAEQTRREMVRGAVWRNPDSAPPRRGEDRFAESDDDALLVAIAAHYAERAASQGRAGLAQRLAGALDRELRGLAKREDKLREDVARAEASRELARQGELLKGALGKVPPRASELELVDPTSGERVRIALDPRLSPAGNLERLFREHRRARKQGERATADLEALASRRAALAGQRAQLDALAADPAAAFERFEALADEPPLRELLRRSARQAPPRERPKPARKGALARLPASLRPRTYRSADGLEIWVGRSDEGNDHLSTRLARGGDLFLHVDGGAGSHVVLRLAGREHAPQESLLDACELAVHFSKQRGAPAAAVLVAPAKDVRKPRGAKPGLVEVRGGRIVRLRREPARLARVLASYSDDET